MALARHLTATSYLVQRILEASRRDPEPWIAATARVEEEDHHDSDDNDDDDDNEQATGDSNSDSNSKDDMRKTWP